MNDIIRQGLADGLSYADYRTLIDALLSEGKTTGANQAPEKVDYTRLNVVRMNRIDKTTVISGEIQEAIASIRRPQTWLVITEAWCGDAAQIVPVINRMARINPLITVRHVLRDDNDPLMNLFLTDGARAIPMVIVIDEEKQRILGHWGPRPGELRRRAAARKKDPDPIPHRDFVIELQKWYTADKGMNIQKEFAEVVTGDRRFGGGNRESATTSAIAE